MAKLVEDSILYAIRIGRNYPPAAVAPTFALRGNDPALFTDLEDARDYNRILGEQMIKGEVVRVVVRIAELEEV